MKYGKNKKSETAPKQTDEGVGSGLIVCRIDMLELWINNISNNNNKLDTRKKFSHFIKTLTKNFSKGSCKGPTYIGPHLNKNTIYVFDEGISQARLIVNSGLYAYLLAFKHLPSSTEMTKRNYNFLWLVRIEIINQKKTLYMQHMQNINTAIRILEVEEGLDISIGKIEIALDTRDEQAGNFIRRYTCLKKPPSYSQLFHVPEDQEESTTYPGPAPDGNNEYHGYRPKSPDSAPERPEGGRKQLFSYMREADDGTRFQRVELRLYRKTARKLKLQYGPTILNVIDSMEKILKNCIWFWKIDIDQLYKESPRARLLSLKKIVTTKGQLYHLKKAGIDKGLITKCNKELPFPKISYPPYPI